MLFIFIFIFSKTLSWLTRSVQGILSIIKEPYLFLLLRLFFLHMQRDSSAFTTNPVRESLKAEDPGGYSSHSKQYLSFGRRLGLLPSVWGTPKPALLKLFSFMTRFFATAGIKQLVAMAPHEHFITAAFAWRINLNYLRWCATQTLW